MNQKFLKLKSVFFGIMVLLFAIFFLSNLTLAQKKTFYKQRYALIVGNSNYQNWNKLPGVENDVEEVAEVLRNKGFHVEVVTDATQKVLKEKIEEFSKKYGYEEENALLFYFAGHGYTDVAFSDKKNQIRYGYFVPIDAPNPKRDAKNFPKFALSTFYFENLVKDLRAKHILFLFDSCFSGNLMESGSKFDATQFCHEMISEPTRQFITAGSANQKVPDESIFRAYFVEGLNGKADLDNDGLILGSELAKFLSQSVSNASGNSQTPQYSKVNRKEYEIGEMIFGTGKVISPETFNRKCQSSSKPRSQTDILLNELKSRHLKISEAFETGNKAVLNLYLADEVVIGQCSTQIPLKKADYLKTLKPNDKRIISTKRDSYKAEKIDEKNAKLELTETYILSDGQNLTVQIVSFYTLSINTWKLRSYNVCTKQK